MRRIAALGIVPLAALIISLAPAGASAAPLYPQCPGIGLDTGCQYLITVTDEGATLSADKGQGPYDGEEDAIIGIQNNSSRALSAITLAATELFYFDEDGLCNPVPIEKTVEKGGHTLAEYRHPPAGCKVLFKDKNGVETHGVNPSTKTGECWREEGACGFEPPVGEPKLTEFSESYIMGYAENGDIVTGYEGPRTYFSEVTEKRGKGIVNISPALAPGESTYVSLEAKGVSLSPVFEHTSTASPDTLSTILSASGKSGGSL